MGIDYHPSVSKGRREELRKEGWSREILATINQKRRLNGLGALASDFFITSGAEGLLFSDKHVEFTYAGVYYVVHAPGYVSAAVKDITWEVLPVADRSIHAATSAPWPDTLLTGAPNPNGGV